MGRGGLFDLEKHFAFYGAYHSNPVNIFIHMLFVWPILFTTLVLLHFTPPLCNLSQTGSFPSGFNHGLVLNFGFYSTVIYSLFYISLDKKAGSLAALLCFICWVAASTLARHLGFSLAWKVVLAAQLFCWTGQFIGHGVFEKRAPALLDNLSQAFIMAPFFVLLEALEMFFGYEPYPGFHASVKAKVKADIKEWQTKNRVILGKVCDQITPSRLILSSQQLPKPLFLYRSLSLSSSSLKHSQSSVNLSPAKSPAG